MRQINHLSINKNDVYAMCKTKNYIIMNNNYEGLKVYNNKLVFITDIKISNDFVIYQIYGSLLNDIIVMIDEENQKQYIIKIKENGTEIKTISQNLVFSSYYYIERENFVLRNYDTTFKFSLYDGREVERFTCEPKIICSNFQDEILFIEDELIFYENSNLKKRMLFQNDIMSRYVVYKQIIVRYTENEIFIYNHFNLQDKIVFNQSVCIANVSFGINSLFVLLYDKGFILRNEIREYTFENRP